MVIAHVQVACVHLDSRNFEPGQLSLLEFLRFKAELPQIIQRSVLIRTAKNVGGRVIGHHSVRVAFNWRRVLWSELHLLEGKFFVGPEVVKQDFILRVLTTKEIHSTIFGINCGLKAISAAEAVSLLQFQLALSNFETLFLHGDLNAPKIVKLSLTACPCHQ